VAVEIPLDDGQPGSDSLEFFLRMEALEGLKESGGILHIKTGPVIADEKDFAAVGGLTADFDLGHVAVTGVFEGVGE